MKKPMFRNTSEKKDFCRSVPMEGTTLSRGVLYICMSVFLAAAPVRAEDLDLSKKSTITDLESAYSKACSMVDSQLESTTTTATADSSGDQRKSLCAAAKTTLKGIKAQATLWKVWAGVAVTCAATCAASMVTASKLDKMVKQNLDKDYCPKPGTESIELKASFYQPMVCLAAVAGASVLDAAKTKQFQSAAMGILTAGFGIAMNKGKGLKDKCGFGQDYTMLLKDVGDGTQETVEKFVRKDVASCMSFTQAALQAMMKRKHQKENTVSLIETIKQAQSLSSIAADTNGTQAATVNFNASSSTSAVGATTAATTVTASNTSTAKSASGGCGDANGAASFSCAIASDKTLPGFVTSPRFKKEVADLTNKSFDDFLKSGASGAGGLISNSVAGFLPKDTRNDLALTLASAENNIDAYVPKAAYAQNGGGSKSSGKAVSNEPDLGGLLGNMLGGLNGEEGAPQAEEAGLQLQFGSTPTREPASTQIDQNRGNSIFDRVHKRYEACSKNGGLK